MNRQTLWTSKYNLPSPLSWAIAILGLAALVFVLLVVPACLNCAIGHEESLVECLHRAPLWRWLIIVAYLCVVCLFLLRPILIAWPAESTKQGPASIGQAALEEHHLRRQSLISTMAAGTIQEIRSPLTAARGFVQLISNFSKEDELAKEYSEFALLEMDRIEQLLQEYMLLSKAVAPRSQPVNLLDAAHNVYQMMDAVMAERNIRLIFEGKQPSCILGDSFYLQQVLQHLLFNAAEATPPKGTIAVTLTSIDDEVILTVKDSGIGMDEEALEHCFDPFFSTKENGTGLGLAICQRMVTDMDGRIEVDSQPETGTTFTLRFPLYTKACNSEGTSS